MEPETTQSTPSCLTPRSPAEIHIVQQCMDTLKASDSQVVVRAKELATEYVKLPVSGSPRDVARYLAAIDKMWDGYVDLRIACFQLLLLRAALSRDQ